MEKIINFKELKYVQPNFEEVKEIISKLAEKVKKAKDIEEIKEAIREFESVYCDMHTNLAIAMIRAYLDSSDKYYGIQMQEGMQKEATINYNEFYNALLNSPYNKEINKEYGEEYLIKLRDSISIKSKGMELIAKEQELICQYQQLKATIKIEFNGEVLSEGEMTKYITSEDRNTRREASIALHKAFIQLKDKFNDILDELVLVRNKIAAANGFSSFADYMNIEKGRREYGQKELLKFCMNIKNELIDFCGFLGEKQAERLVLETLASYDCSCSFIDGNAKPIGDGEKLREEAKTMYADLSNDISELYNTMVDNEYIDVSSSPNKISGMGFCTELFNIKFPYVFGNCNGSIHDVDVLTHEVGHAYQMYLSLNNKKLSAYSAMPNDVAEIPSKTMEHFTQDYSQLFFGKDAEKFSFQFLEQVLNELLAYCAIHEYESWLYSNPEATSEERAKKYYEGMVEIDPNVDYSDIEEFMKDGSSLFRSMGVYMFPFYLISYAISAISAIEFAKRMSEDKKSTWEDYTKLCAAGGSLSYKELLQVANLNLPFEKSTIENSVGFIKGKILKYIDNKN